MPKLLSYDRSYHVVKDVEVPTSDNASHFTIRAKRIGYRIGILSIRDHNGYAATGKELLSETNLSLDQVKNLIKVAFREP